MFSSRFWDGLGTGLKGFWRTSEDTFGRPGASSGGNWGYGAGLAAQELPGDAAGASNGPEMARNQALETLSEPDMGLKWPEKLPEPEMSLKWPDIVPKSTQHPPMIMTNT